MTSEFLNQIGSWRGLLPQTVTNRAISLAYRADKETQEGHPTYPARENIFRALELTQPADVKVVIIGQDPYHEAGQANGLAFSVNNGLKIPPSLRNIFKELCNDIGCKKPDSGDLSGWAKQGVLLLNTVLTVSDGKANSHKDWGWQEFTSAVIQVCDKLSQPIVYILLGVQARDFCAQRDITRQDRLAICTSHPSPLAANRGDDIVPAFIGSKSFSQANTFLQQKGVASINWACI